VVFRRFAASVEALPYPRLAPWAALYRRFAASLETASRFILGEDNLSCSRPFRLGILIQQFEGFHST
jgi:hypothetical protein